MVALFPIETQSRELDYKLILAHYCAEKYGLDAFVGSVPSINSNVHKFRNGLYFSKTIFSNPSEKQNRKFYAGVKALGIDIAYLHEEGGVWNGNEDDWKRTLNKMYDLSIFDEKDMVMLWGQWQKQAEETRNEKGIPLYVTGSPRFDLLDNYKYLYADKVRDIKKKYGDFILVNGKYTIANHGESFHKATEDVARHIGDYSENMKRFFGMINFTARKMFEMAELVATCALALPHVNFVFRPHPSEKMETYVDLFSRIDNIYIEREGSANAYILAAKAMVHDGCTTSLEAACSGVHILNFVKAKNKLDVYLPGQVGIPVCSGEELIPKLQSILISDEDYRYISDDNLSKSLLLNLSGQSSFERIFGILDDYFAHKDQSGDQQPSRFELQKWYYKKRLKIKGSNFKNTILGRRDKLSKTRYLLSKFPGLEKEDIKRKIDLLNEKEGKNVKIDFINTELIRLYS